MAISTRVPSILPMCISMMPLGVVIRASISPVPLPSTMTGRHQPDSRPAGLTGRFSSLITKARDS